MQEPDCSIVSLWLKSEYDIRPPDFKTVSTVLDLNNKACASFSFLLSYCLCEQHHADEDCIVIAALLTLSRSVKHLDLHGNEIGDDGLSALAASFKVQFIDSHIRRAFVL